MRFGAPRAPLNEAQKGTMEAHAMLDFHQWLTLTFWQAMIWASVLGAIVLVFRRR